jgi:CRP-like cAMP-binding protein
MGDTATFLGSIPLFAALEPRALDRLAAFCDVSTYRRGQLVLIRGEVPTRLYAVRSGSLELERRSPRRVETLSRGAVFGEGCLLAAAACDATVRAAEDGTVLLEIRGALLDGLWGSRN